MTLLYIKMVLKFFHAPQPQSFLCGGGQNLLGERPNLSLFLGAGQNIFLKEDKFVGGKKIVGEGG